MVDKELLSRKLSQLREYLVALRNAEDITWKKYEEGKLFSIHHSLADIANVNIENLPLRAHAQ
jgi:hypothetical protein